MQEVAASIGSTVQTSDAISLLHQSTLLLNNFMPFRLQTTALIEHKYGSK